MKALLSGTAFVGHLVRSLTTRRDPSGKRAAMSGGAHAHAGVRQRSSWRQTSVAGGQEAKSDRWDAPASTRRCRRWRLAQRAPGSAIRRPSPWASSARAPPEKEAFDLKTVSNSAPYTGAAARGTRRRGSAGPRSAGLRALGCLREPDSREHNPRKKRRRRQPAKAPRQSAPRSAPGRSVRNEGCEGAVQPRYITAA